MRTQAVVLGQTRAEASHVAAMLRRAGVAVSATHKLDRALGQDAQLYVVPETADGLDAEEISSAILVRHPESNVVILDHSHHRLTTVPPEALTVIGVDDDASVVKLGDWLKASVRPPTLRIRPARRRLL